MGLTVNGEFVYDTQVMWAVGDRCTVPGKGKGRIESFRDVSMCQVLLDSGQFVMIHHTELTDRVSLREQALAKQ